MSGAAIRDLLPVNPPRERIFNIPGAVLALSALLVAIQVIVEYALTDRQYEELLTLFAFSPMRYADLVPVWLPAWWGPQLWTFVSYAFFHANFTHLIFNLVWLLAFGPPIARRFGTVRFMIFCVATSVSGADALIF